MSGNKKFGLAVWGLGLILANAVLICLSRGPTPTLWVTFGFVWLAFISALIFQLIVWKRVLNQDEQVLHVPALTVSYVYMVIQIPLCVLFALGANVFSWKAALLVHLVLLVLAWTAAIGSLVGNDHIRKVNARQKDHHIEL